MIKQLFTLKNEKGTTVAELMIYIVILVVLISGAYVIYQGAEAIYYSSSSQAEEQQDARLAQLLITKNIRMAESFVIVGDYSLKIKADIDDNNLWDDVSFYIDNNKLYYKVNNNSSQLIANNVRNIALNEHLFNYYDMKNQEITETASRFTKTTSMIINLVVDKDLNRSPEPYKLSAEVALRNKD